MIFISSLLALSLSTTCVENSSYFYVAQNNQIINSEFLDFDNNSDYVNELICENRIQTCSSVTVLTHGIGGSFDDFLINNRKLNLHSQGYRESITGNNNDSNLFTNEINDTYSIYSGSILDRIQNYNYRVDSITQSYLQSSFNIYVFGKNIISNDYQYSIRRLNNHGSHFELGLLSEYGLPGIAHNYETKSSIAASIIFSDLNSHDGFHDHSFVNSYDSSYHFLMCACGAKSSVSEHTLVCSQHNSINHIKNCCDCNYEFSEEHLFEYSNIDMFCHSKLCSSCSQYYTESHYKGIFQQFSITKHRVFCICGKTYSSENHSYINGTLTCSKCGQINGTGGTDPILPPIILEEIEYEED